MIKKLIQKPFLFFLGLVLISLLFGLFTSSEKMLDINIHDTYLIIAYKHLYYFSAILFSLISLDYFLLHLVERFPIKWLTTLHIILQLLSLLFLFTPDRWNWLFPKSNSPLLNDLSYSNVIIVFSFFIFFISILIHLINFLVSLLAKKE